MFYTIHIFRKPKDRSLKSQSAPLPVDIKKEPEDTSSDLLAMAVQHDFSPGLQDQTGWSDDFLHIGNAGEVQ